MTSHAQKKFEQNRKAQQTFEAAFDIKAALESLYSNTMYDQAFSAHMKVFGLHAKYSACNECDREDNLHQLQLALDEAKKHEITFQLLSDHIKREKEKQDTDDDCKKRRL